MYYWYHVTTKYCDQILALAKFLASQTMFSLQKWNSYQLNSNPVFLFRGPGHYHPSVQQGQMFLTAKTVPFFQSIILKDVYIYVKHPHLFSVVTHSSGLAFSKESHFLSHV